MYHHIFTKNLLLGSSIKHTILSFQHISSSEMYSSEFNEMDLK